MTRPWVRLRRQGPEPLRQAGMTRASGTSIASIARVNDTLLQRTVLCGRTPRRYFRQYGAKYDKAVACLTKEPAGGAVAAPNLEPFRTAAEQIISIPGAAARRDKLDVRSAAAVDAFAQQAIGAFGAPDILVNCAGFVHHGTVLDCSEADGRRAARPLATGVMGPPTTTTHRITARARSLRSHRLRRLKPLTHLQQCEVRITKLSS
jgi:NAD(P)-dependent dehydrogenase (short-subunit alcohol dehydrogenase family)